MVSLRTLGWSLRGKFLAGDDQLGKAIGGEDPKSHLATSFKLAFVDLDRRFSQAHAERVPGLAAVGASLDGICLLRVGSRSWLPTQVHCGLLDFDSARYAA